MHPGLPLGRWFILSEGPPHITNCCDLQGSVGIPDEGGESRGARALPRHAPKVDFQCPGT